MVFRTRSCKDFICNYAQKGRFLQRRKSACLCGCDDSHKSTTYCKDLDDDARKKTKKCDALVRMQVSTQAWAHKRVLLMLVYLRWFSQEHHIFLSLLHEHSPNPYSMWRSCENPSKHTSTHFCDVAKKAPAEHIYIWNPYMSGSEKPSKKSAKKGVPTSSDLRLLNTITFCKINKVLIRSNNKRFWRGQTVNVHLSDLSVVFTIRLFQKKRNFYKKVSKTNKTIQLACWVPKWGVPEC